MSRAKRLLVINPNSSAAVSQRLGDVADIVLTGRAVVQVATAADGPAYLGDPDTMRAGEAAAIATARNLCIDRGETFDAVVMGALPSLGSRRYGRCWKFRFAVCSAPRCWRRAAVAGDWGS